MAAVHAHDPHFHICCGIGECARTYSNFFSFKRHLYRKHRDCLEMDGPFITTVPEDNTSYGDEIDANNGGEDYLPDDRENSQSTRYEHMKQMALFVLKTKEIRKVSQSALDGLINDFTLILQQSICSLKADVNRCLSANGVSISMFDGLDEVFEDSSKLNPFNQLESKFLQEKFFREHLDLLVRSFLMYFCFVSVWESRE